MLYFKVVAYSPGLSGCEGEITLFLFEAALHAFHHSCNAFTSVIFLSLPSKCDLLKSFQVIHTLCEIEGSKLTKGFLKPALMQRLIYTIQFTYKSGDVQMVFWDDLFRRTS